MHRCSKSHFASPVGADRQSPAAAGRKEQEMGPLRDSSARRAVAASWRQVIRFPVVVATLLMLSVAPAIAQEPSDTPLDRVAGRVAQATEGADLPVGLEATLRVFDADGNLFAEVAQPLDADGAFSFTDLPGDRDFPERYQVSVDYGDIRRTVPVAEAADPEDIELLVFESTQFLDVIAVQTHSTVIEAVDPDQGFLRVLELIDLTNVGDRAFTPDLSGMPDTMPELLTFSLPPGYSELSVETTFPSSAFVELDNGFAVFTPVPPGDFRLLLSYAVWYEEEQFVFPRNLPYGARELRFLFPQGIGPVSGDGLTAGDDTVIGERAYRTASGTDYVRGSAIAVHLSGLPRPSLTGTPTGGEGGVPWLTTVVPSSAGAAILALVAYALYRRARRTAAPVSVSRPESGANYVEAIAALDERFEAGELGEDDYRRLRDDLVGRALDNPTDTL